MVIIILPMKQTKLWNLFTLIPVIYRCTRCQLPRPEGQRWIQMVRWMNTNEKWLRLNGIINHFLMCRFGFRRFSKCWPTETEIFGLWNSQPKPTEVIGKPSVSVGFRFRSVLVGFLGFLIIYFLRKQTKKKKMNKPRKSLCFPTFSHRPNTKL